MTPWQWFWYIVATGCGLAFVLMLTALLGTAYLCLKTWAVGKPAQVEPVMTLDEEAAVYGPGGRRT